MEVVFLAKEIIINNLYTIIDIETTGGKFNEEGITEIAIYKFDGNEVVDKLVSLVNPEKPIQPFVVNLTGINDKMLVNAPKFFELAKRIVEITEGTTIVAHNAQFDYRILKTEFERLGFSYNRESLCTVSLAQELIPGMESYSLGKLVRALGIPMSDRHRADGDALATVKLFKLLLSKDTDKKIVTSLIKKEQAPKYSRKQRDIIEQLPSETGIYYMHAIDGSILHLSKSKNIKRRVSQHFSKSDVLSKALQKATKSVSYDLTGNELIAALKEEEELKKTKPKYVSKFKHKNMPLGLFLETTPKGYLCLKTYRVNAKLDLDPLWTFTTLKSVQQFLEKLVLEFKLCPHLSGLQAQLFNGQPKNDCSLDLSAEQYNSRVDSAINRYSIQGKNVVIVDKGRALGEQSAILIKEGVFKGYGFVELNHQISNLAILESLITPINGNLLSKHLIEVYLKKKRRLKIIPIPQN